MSASTTAMGHVHYKDQLKLMRAETATAWMVAVFSWVVEALRSKPVVSERVVVEAPAQQRYFGAFHC